VVCVFSGVPEMRAYRWLQRLFLPHDFRAQYGDAMAELYEERCRALSTTLFARMRYGLNAAIDVIAQGLAERRRQGRGDGGSANGWGEGRRDGQSMNRCGQDLHHAVRSLWRGRGVSLAAVCALGMGIGLTTLMFSIVYGILLRQVPLPAPERLVELSRVTVEGRAIVRVHEYDDWRSQLRSFTELGAYRAATLRVTGDGVGPVTVRGVRMTPSIFRVLGVQPRLGRLFSEADDQPGGPGVMLISEEFWESNYVRDPAIVGRTVRVDGRPTTIVGVMPDRFTYPEVEHAWVPLREDVTTYARGTGAPLRLVGRLAEGVSVDAARVELETVQRRLAAEYPETNRDVAARIAGLIDNRVNPQARTTLLATFGAVVFVLLIVCGNVASLLIGRATVRAREVGVRIALGATRWRVMSIFLIEALVLALTGALIGTALGAVGVHWFNGAVMASAEPPPFWVDIRLDGMALLVVFAACLFATIAAGLAPALQAARANTHNVLKDESRGASSFRMGRLSRVIVVAEMALSLALLVGAGLVVKGVVRLYTIDLGFDADRVFATRIMLPDSTYPGAQAKLQFAGQVIDRVRALSGVRSAVLTSVVPGMDAGRSARHDRRPAH